MKTAIRRGESIEIHELRITPYVREIRVCNMSAGQGYAFYGNTPCAIVLEYRGEQFAFDMEGKPLSIASLPAE